MSPAFDSGCCGMAGAWGYEDAHYDVSMACAERVLLPAVRQAPSRALVVTDGFSCRSQIEQAGTGRSALHLAQVLQLAARHGPGGLPGARPELLADGPPQRSRRRRLFGPLGIAGLAAGALALTRCR